MISIKRMKIEDWRIMILIFKGCKIERLGKIGRKGVKDRERKTEGLRFDVTLIQVTH